MWPTSRHRRYNNAQRHGWLVVERYVAAWITLQLTDSAQQIDSSAVSALALFVAMNSSDLRPGDVHRVTTIVAGYADLVQTSGRILLRGQAWGA